MLAEVENEVEFKTERKVAVYLVDEREDDLVDEVKEAAVLSAAVNHFDWRKNTISGSPKHHKILCLQQRKRKRWRNKHPMFLFSLVFLFRPGVDESVFAVGAGFGEGEGIRWGT